MMMRFEKYIGIDYSGAGKPTHGHKGLQVYLGDAADDPIILKPPTGTRWSRWSITTWLVEQIASSSRVVAGIDHGFSLPQEQFYGATIWPAFLQAFTDEWNSDERQIRKVQIEKRHKADRKALRLTENWTSSAKSVFNTNGPGVSLSTFAGIPWLYRIRQKLGDTVHFWPFDGWVIPDGRSAIVEVYPAIFKNRYPSEGRNGDEQDAYATARWLMESDQRGILDQYLHPPLTKDERKQAELEGWILGIT